MSAGIFLNSIFLNEMMYRTLHAPIDLKPLFCDRLRLFGFQLRAQLLQNMGLCATNVGPYT